MAVIRSVIRYVIRPVIKPVIRILAALDTDEIAFMLGRGKKQWALLYDGTIDVTSEEAIGLQFSRRI